MVPLYCGLCGALYLRNKTFFLVKKNRGLKTEIKNTQQAINKTVGIFSGFLSAFLFDISILFFTLSLGLMFFSLLGNKLIFVIKKIKDVSFLSYLQKPIFEHISFIISLLSIIPASIFMVGSFIFFEKIIKKSDLKDIFV